MALFFHAVVILFLLPALLSATPKVELKIEPNVKEIYIEEGTKQALNCSATYNGDNNGHKLIWMFNGQTHGSTTHESVVIQKNAILRKNIDAQNPGKYTCQFLNVTSNEDVKVDITLISVKEVKVEPLFKFGMEKVELSCDIEIPDGANKLKTSAPVWYKNGTKVEEKKDERFKFENNSLIINLPIRKDAGLYTAKFDVESKSPYECHVALRAGPLVLDFEKSKNLIQEDDMDLRCQVLGYPHAMVTWYKDDLVINSSTVTLGDSRVKLHDHNGYKNARLTILKVDYDDAGSYKCLAYSKALNSSDYKVIVVRVKDKLAALWPFLGIVGEVIVLCTIIFIYEKRRNKQADQANNDAHEADPAEKKSNVRNRRNQK